MAERGAASPVLEVRDLRVEARIYPPDGEPYDATIVDGVSFLLPKGRVLGLIGESGAGKSTVGLAALGYGRGGCRLVGGAARLDGVDLLRLDLPRVRRLRGRVVTYVAQSAAAAFNPAQRIGPQVVEAAIKHGVYSRADAEQRAVRLFERLRLPEPAQFGRRFPHQVSGGQLQRAMTALALCPGPDLVVFDEPTTALDVTTQVEVLAAIKDAIRDSHTAALYISHDLAVVAQIADDIMVLRHGKMVEYGSAGQIITAPREDYTRRLVAVRSVQKPEAAPKNDPLLVAEGVTATYANLVPVLENVSVRVDRGETLAIVGESGSGKSTLARVITGLLPPLSGRLQFAGATLAPRLAERTREQLRRIQMIYQMPDTAMNPRHTVGQIIGRPLEFYFGLDAASRRRRVAELLDQIEMGGRFMDRYPAELSGGQKQRVCIARALAADPELVICDEVTSALDPLVADEILKLMLRLQQEKGLSYLVITHDIATVRAIADSVAVMYRGGVVRHGTKRAVLSPPFDDYTGRLLASVPEMRLGWLDDILSKRGSALGVT
ncbi:MAG TPA: ABC transporter ATP-binding protein [Hypericibacter adhaerens]|jgi:peptide/nickel transport system ATP-binding protein|uniref:ABC transporter ATP-binding protein n=1 Tax=Hypericibacter adhaerens TaxID=2602016 RepID=A0A5J6MYJ6_9PROT|nr:ABC transporter ATP-binding protein [Hypericibacter adhaerens]QEX22659.1 ABC transporter ATP-binding protein [Hypericibacter adhaerens]HWA45417.1 ABC transporter ATP-binding protein [Hypericibacter adhaerens]